MDRERNSSGGLRRGFAAVIHAPTLDLVKEKVTARHFIFDMRHIGQKVRRPDRTTRPDRLNKGEVLGPMFRPSNPPPPRHQQLPNIKGQTRSGLL